MGMLTKRGHLGPRHGSCHYSKSKVRGRPAPLPEAVGWLARLSQRRELGLPGASRVLLSDLPRTSLRFINKTSASVPSNHSLFLQVTVGTREVFFLRERKKHERKIRIVPRYGLQISCATPALQLFIRLYWLPRLCCPLAPESISPAATRAVCVGVCAGEEGGRRGQRGWGCAYLQLRAEAPATPPPHLQLLRD